MLFLKYLLCTIGSALLLAGAGIVIYDLYQTFKRRTPRRIRSHTSMRLGISVSPRCSWA
jgi:hypothetical protein